MISSKFANTGSGVLADKIGWFDFGPNFTLTPNAPLVHVINSLPNGYTIEFDIQLVNNQGALTSLSALQPPVYGNAAFGNTGYIGIQGEVVLYSPYPEGTSSNETIKIMNIVVKNSKGVATSTFQWVFADAETTNYPESLLVKTNGSPWALLENVAPVDGGIANTPDLSGVGTTVVQMEGVDIYPANPSGPVLISHCPQSIEVTMGIAYEGKQGVAFGVIISDREQAINDMIESIALQQTGLSHILNAEGEKIQKIVGLGTKAEMIAINQSVCDVVDTVATLEILLKNKLQPFLK